MNENLQTTEAQNLPKKVDCTPDIPQLKHNIGLDELVLQLTKAQREKYVSGRDFKKFVMVFEDEELMSTVDAFLDNAMNISRTARILYMHRNTLAYRLDKVKKLTGMDIKNFDEAITFLILKSLYENK